MKKVLLGLFMLFSVLASAQGAPNIEEGLFEANTSCVDEIRSTNAITYGGSHGWLGVTYTETEELWKVCDNGYEVKVSTTVYTIHL